MMMVTAGQIFCGAVFILLRAMMICHMILLNRQIAQNRMRMFGRPAQSMPGLIDEAGK